MERKPTQWQGCTGLLVSPSLPPLSFQFSSPEQWTSGRPLGSGGAPWSEQSVHYVPVEGDREERETKESREGRNKEGKGLREEGEKRERGKK